MLKIDGPLAGIEADGTAMYYNADALGSVTVLTDSFGLLRQDVSKNESFRKTDRCSVAVAWQTEKDVFEPECLEVEKFSS